MMRKTKTKTIAIATAMVTLKSASAVFAATTSNSPAQTHMFSQTRSGGVNAKNDINNVQEDAIQGSLDWEETGIY